MSSVCTGAGDVGMVCGVGFGHGGSVVDICFSLSVSSSVSVM